MRRACTCTQSFTLRQQKNNMKSRIITIAVLSIAVVGLTPFVHAALTINANVFAKDTFAITGSVSKGGGTFAIDNPIDPANKILFHSFVESPDALNQYNGIALLDAAGAARIRLPDYFDSLNKNFTYQFFPMNAAMPGLYIQQRIQDNEFVIAGGTPGGTVSWMVTGIRHDPYILANPIVVEVEKGPSALLEKGQCIHEPLCI